MHHDWHGPDWHLTLDDSGFALEAGSTRLTIPAAACPQCNLRRQRLRWYLTPADTPPVRLRRLRAKDARSIILCAQVAGAVHWHRELQALIERHTTGLRWISRDAVASIVALQPVLDTRLMTPRTQDALQLTEAERGALASVALGTTHLIEAANERIVELELRERRTFLDSIEQRPLTYEQSRAVLCYDNRVQVVAAAGSGKTSIMVARAGYALMRGFTAPERILLLAFNRDAASELQDRVNARLQHAGIDASGVRATTFHAFGLEVIGHATGHRPSVAPWIEQQREIAEVADIVEGLRATSVEYAYRWDLYRFLFADLEEQPGTADVDAYDTKARTSGFRSLDGTLVRSHGERLIADWLYLHGVTYQYERAYVATTSDATHRQYQPDFYYPDIDTWHEHWALDADGNPPATFTGYREDMQWKRDLHQRNGTSLIETTFADIVLGDGLRAFEEELRQRGQALRWDPERPLATKRRVNDEDILRLIRTFMTHVKSSGLTAEQVAERADIDRKRHGYRTQLFLGLFWPVFDEWNRRLRAGNHVDFDEMLVRAAALVEEGRYTADFDLVLVDELQDASISRARLIKALVARPGVHLLAVGDDWQAINRFAGADLSVMTHFHDWFGAGPTLQLTTTFRNPQSISDVASTFVLANPEQITKYVQSVHGAAGQCIRLIRSARTRDALAAYLTQLSADVRAGNVRGAHDGTLSVDILGRYRHLREIVPARIPANLNVTFRTVHSAKGLEADVVIIPGMVAGTYGFPSTIGDDTVLQLVMADAGTFPPAEERRLFYVALTRARIGVTLMTEPGRESPFITELMRADAVEPVDLPGMTSAAVELCPQCGVGTLVLRQGPYGRFLGCSRFPACTGTRQLL